MREIDNTFYSRIDMYDFLDELKKLTNEQALVMSTTCLYAQEDIMSVLNRL